MIEFFGKSTERVASSTEKTELPANFDPDKRFVPKEKGNSLQDSRDAFDPDKRFIPKENGSSLQDRDETFNPDIRVYSGVPSREKTNVLKEESDKRVADSENQIQNTDISPSENELNDHTYKTDDNGNIYNVDGKNLPNCKYELNGYEYETDEKGRIIRAEGDLELPPYQPRPNSLPDIEDRRTEEDERGRDDKGHLIAHEFGGADTEGNLVPMNYEVNEYGEFRKLERELKNAKEEGHDVHVTVEPQYDDDSKRPSSFTVTYTIDDETYEKVIVNEAKSGEN